MSSWKGSPGMWRVPESSETPVAGRSYVRHNRDGEKNGEVNQVERDISAVTEGCPSEMHTVRKSDAVYGAAEGELCPF